MKFQHRIRTIYWKELIDIMRDRRTLIAMIVVPIVLYPLLMLGSIQAVSFQADAIGRDKIIIGVWHYSYSVCQSILSRSSSCFLSSTMSIRVVVLGYRNFISPSVGYISNALSS